MAEQFDFYTELDPSLRIRIPETVNTIVFRRGHYRTGDPREIMTLQADPRVTGPPDVKVELREPVLVEPEETVLGVVPEMGQCGATTLKGDACTIPVMKAGASLCHVHERLAKRKEEAEVGG